VWPRRVRGKRTAGPYRVRREKNILGLGARPWNTSLAAHTRVSLPFGILRIRGTWIAAIVLLLASAVPAAAQSHSKSAEFPSSNSSSLDSDDSLEVTRASLPPSYQEPPPQQPGTVIDRILFTGNRRIRTDTLKARIFSRDGDPYNEETLRRDFQALWNTQFFEDVKLRVEDSPDGPNHKNVIFDVKERPVIRRIRYDGIHSVS
jgi:outer membrane protein assembly factor BamA